MRGEACTPDGLECLIRGVRVKIMESPSRGRTRYWPDAGFHDHVALRGDQTTLQGVDLSGLRPERSSEFVWVTVWPSAGPLHRLRLMEIQD